MSDHSDFLVAPAWQKAAGWQRGAFIAHRDGSIRQLVNRKTSADLAREMGPAGGGWRLADGSGLADWVIERGGWIVLSPENIQILFAAVSDSRTTS